MAAFRRLKCLGLRSWSQSDIYFHHGSITPESYLNGIPGILPPEPLYQVGNGCYFVAGNAGNDII